MSIEDVIKNFCSQHTGKREHDENVRASVIAEYSHCSRCTQNEMQCSVNMETTIEDLLSLHPPVVIGCKLKDILHHASLEDYQDLRCLKILECFALGLLKLGEIHLAETEWRNDLK